MNKTINEEIQPGSIELKQKSREELIQLAKDLRAGKIFGDWMIPEAEYTDMVGSVFMLLHFGVMDNFKNVEDVGAAYEYLNVAAPLSINGYPSFFSVRWLHKDDLPILASIGEELEAAERTVH